MNLLRVVAVSLLCSSGACSPITVGGRGVPCGGGLQVDAAATLPDSGLGAGGKAQIGFVETKPPSLAEANLIVWTFPAAINGFADAPPRVRVVTDSGRVFLDLQSTSAYQGSWYVRQLIPEGPIRDEIVAAFQQGIVTVEFIGAPPEQRITHVRPSVRFAGATPVLTCV